MPRKGSELTCWSCCRIARDRRARYDAAHSNYPSSRRRGATTVTPQQFIAKWQRVTLSERSTCRLRRQPEGADADEPLQRRPAWLDLAAQKARRRTLRRLRLGCRDQRRGIAGTDSEVETGAHLARLARILGVVCLLVGRLNAASTKLRTAFSRYKFAWRRFPTPLSGPTTLWARSATHCRQKRYNLISTGDGERVRFPAASGNSLFRGFRT